jgi:hypothetical protein
MLVNLIGENDFTMKLIRLTHETKAHNYVSTTTEAMPFFPISLVVKTNLGKVFSM